MASMVPYHRVLGIHPSTILDALDDIIDLSPTTPARAFLMDVEDKGESYEVKAYLAGVSKEDIDVELNEGRLSISAKVEEKSEDVGKNYLKREFGSFRATRGVYLKDASSEGLSARFADGVLTVRVPKIVEKKNVTKVAID